MYGVNHQQVWELMWLLYIAKYTERDLIIGLYVILYSCHSL